MKNNQGVTYKIIGSGLTAVTQAVKWDYDSKFMKMSPFDSD